MKDILQTPPEVVKEREEARQLLTNLSADYRELLYRLSSDVLLHSEEITRSTLARYQNLYLIQEIFLVNWLIPWIDQVNETYYTISPLLTNAAREVWSDESKINDLHAQIADCYP